MKKRLGKILACVLAASCVMTAIPVNALAAGEVEQTVNYALQGTATANEVEVDYAWGAEKAIDGVINRDATPKTEQSRWSTKEKNETGSQAVKELTVDLGQSRTIDSFKIAWERTNIKGFTISVSSDGTSYNDVYTKEDSSYVNQDTEIQLDTPAVGRYVKLSVDNYDGGDINWASVSVYEFEILGKETLSNLALNKTATSSGDEAATVAASKAVDGNLGSADEKSQWGSTQGHDTKWLQVDLGEVTQVGSVVIEWERLNATDYTILTSIDGQSWTEEVHRTKAASSFRDVINLSEVKDARYVKVQINEFTDTEPDRYGNTVTWDTVAIVELEVYASALQASGGSAMDSATTIDEVIAALEIPEISEDDAKWTLPEVADGFTIELIGADYEQVIDDDLTIYKPLTDKVVSVNYRISKDGDFKETSAYEVTVPGRYTASEADNAKPIVIPELAEWKGAEGNFEIVKDSKVVINPTYKDALAVIAETFPVDYEDITGNTIEVTYGTDPAAGDFYFTLGSEDAGLKEEGYLMTVEDEVKVEAVDKTGAYWSTRTILQILKQNGTTIPKGITRDYPKYEVRGFMLDVGRKPFKMEYLYDTVKMMAWYKMNDLALHLNDNYIWVEEYDDQFDAYSAFRLESDIKAGGNEGRNQADLTSTDLYYTKDEFRALIQDSRELGIDIVPEFDAPAHSLAFTKVRPDLTMPEGSVTRWADHFYLANPESEEFVKSVWNEYITGDNPVFDQDTILNIGTDEYEGNNNDFRQFTANMINFVQDSGRTVRLWGSLTAKSGTVEVPSEDVQMYIWSTGWASPKQMYEEGYELINIQDTYVYIVPSGTGSVGAYGDYLNTQNLYNNWSPNVMGGVTIPAGSEQMLGGSFAIWNDNIDLKATGLGEYDIYQRFASVVPAISSKQWGDGKDLTYAELEEKAEIIGTAPDSNPYYEVETKTSTVMDYDFDDSSLKDDSGNKYDGTEGENTSYEDGKEGKALRLNGGSSYVTTPIENIGPSNEVSFWIKADGDTEGEQIILESDNAAIKAVQKDTGKFGYSRDETDYSFNYTLPQDEWVYITIKGYVYRTELYVNGELVDTLGKGMTGNKYATTVLPAARIGSLENAFTGLIDELTFGTVKEVDDSATIIPSDGFKVTCDNEYSPGTDTEGTIDKAFDGNTGTIWHSNWNPYQALPATIEVDMGQVYKIDQVDYLPRQDSSVNGVILQYEIYGKLTEDAEYTLLAEGNWANSKDIKKTYFDPTEVRYLKIVALDGATDSGNKFASAAEFYIHEYDAKAELRALVEEAEEYTEAELYTEDSWAAFVAAKENAQKVLDAEDADEEAIADAAARLAEAMEGLKGVEEPEKPADKKALKEAIKAAEELNEKAYTEQSWAVLKEALDAAKKVAATDSAAQAEVDKALEDLMAAKNALVLIVKLPYTDVEEGRDWFYDYVYDVYVKELMTGLNETTFGPSQNLARAQFAIILYRMEGEPDVKYTDKFPDVEENIWYTDAILWAAENGIVTGYSDTGKFGPSDNITREQMAVMMYRYAKYKNLDVTEEKSLDEFPDGDKVQKFAVDGMEWCTAKGIISGKGEEPKLLDPQGNTNRAECATIISRYTEIQ